MRLLDGITHSMDTSFENIPGVGNGQGSLACCSQLCHKESDMTEQLKWTELTWTYEISETQRKKWKLWMEP